MGGLGPGIGGMEYLVIAIVALVVVGPERLPAMLHKLGKLVAKARNMAGEFRASFDEMARQSELDELRKEVEALRSGQGMHALGADGGAVFAARRAAVSRPVDAAPPSPVRDAPDEWPDAAPVMAPLEAPASTKPAKPQTRRKPKTAATKAKPAAAKTPPSKSAPARKASPKRATKVDL